MSERDETTLFEAHRDALQGVLCAEANREKGLPAHDIARALGLSGDETSTLLAEAEGEEAVRMNLEHEPALWVSTSRLPPAVVPPRPSPPAKRPNRQPMVLAGGALVAVGVIAFMMTGPSDSAPAPAAPATHTVTTPTPAPSPEATRRERIEERATAQAAGEEVKRLQREAVALNQRMRAWATAAADAKCQTAWNAGESCYLTGRMMSQSAFEKEATKMGLRSKEIATLLEQHRGEGATAAE